MKIKGEKILIKKKKKLLNWKDLFSHRNNNWEVYLLPTTYSQTAQILALLS